MSGNNAPAAGFKFNTFQEIKSHSSVLFNERMAILFYLLDMNSIELNTNYNVPMMMKVKATLWQIYKDIRTLIRNNPTCRVTLNLETKDPGVYVPDVIFDTIERMIQYCQHTEYTYRRVYVITQELNKVELILKDILQYFHYFIRPDFRQKPDIEMATEKYKEIADKKTVEELREIIGNKRHHLDFDDLLKSGQIGMNEPNAVDFDDDTSSGNLEMVHEDDEPNDD